MMNDSDLMPYNPGIMDTSDMYDNNTTVEATTYYDNDSTLAPNTTLVPLTSPVCQIILYKEIASSQVRIWDLIILIPNVLFLSFVVYKAKPAIIKLRQTNSPIFTAFYVLVSLVAIISVLRCVVSMTVNATLEAGDIADKVLWLVLRFFLLATEMSVVIFGLAFGHLDGQTSIRHVLFSTFFISLVYSTTQGVLEFKYPDDTFHVKHDEEEFDIFGHGGMLFWFISSMFFCLIYTVICILPFTSARNRFALPTRRGFYLYCGLLSVLNAVQAVGSGMLHYDVAQGLCIVNATTYLYFTCFAPLVYLTFLRDFFRTTQPRNILFSYKSQIDDLDDDGHLPQDEHHRPHTYIPNKAPRDINGDVVSGDPSSDSYDSTHFDAALSPNPLYDADVPYTGNNAELSINSSYFGHPTSSFSREQELQNPIA